MTRSGSRDVWRLSEGELLPNGTRVVSIHRDPANSRIVMGTDDGVQRTLHRDDRLVVSRRVGLYTHISRSLRAAAQETGWSSQDAADDERPMCDSPPAATDLAMALSRLAGPADIDSLMRHETTWIVET